jgi:mannose-6-phosphate isomerase
MGQGKVGLQPLFSMTASVVKERQSVDMSLNGQCPATELAPFRIEPRFVERVWGFADLHPWYDKVAGSAPLGEVWLTGDECLVATGPHAGQTLASLFAEAPQALLGAQFHPSDEDLSPGIPQAPDTSSPLLIKVLFAKEKLSVQVHPDDKLAQKYGDPRGKTECWYALAAEPGAQVACGLKSGVTIDQVREEIKAETLESSLTMLDVSPEEMIFVDAGTVHAIWPGSILLETQQNCDLTYRLYDYGRGRELHIEKGLEATKLVTKAGKVEPVETEPGRTTLLSADYFLIERVKVDGSISGASLRGDAAREMQYLFAAAGTARISGDGFEAVELARGSIAAVPAGSPEFLVEDMGGLELIRITPRWPETRA